MNNNKHPRRLDEILEELRCCPESILFQYEQQRQQTHVCPNNCKILEALNSIESKLTNTQSSCEDLSKEWVDNQDVMQLLHISPRTLQTLRTNGTLPFSRIGNKLYYRTEDIQRILKDNYTMFKCRESERKAELVRTLPSESDIHASKIRSYGSDK